MARRKNQPNSVRKISTIGNYSLGITFPRNILASLGWKNKQKVVVKRIPRGILITDYPSPKRKK